MRRCRDVAILEIRSETLVVITQCGAVEGRKAGKLREGKVASGCPLYGMDGVIR